MLNQIFYDNKKYKTHKYIKSENRGEKTYKKLEKYSLEVWLGHGVQLK